MANGGGNATGSGNSSSKKPHAVFIPFPLQGHITPLLKLAKLFHHRGFQITFVNAAFINRRLLKSSAAGALTSPSSSSVADFRFETIPDGLHFGDDEEITPQLMYFICEASRYNFVVPFRHLVSKLNHEDSAAAPVTCIVSDAHMAFPITVAQEIGVPSFLFWPNSACGFMSIKHHNLLKQRSLIPLKDELADTIVDWIPGLKDIRLKDVPFAEIDKYDFPMREMEEAYKASGIIFNTFDILEQDVLDAISAMFPHVYTIGPLQLLLNSTSDDGSIGCSLWEEESECLQWLNSMKPNSVVYISFGSVAVVEPQQLTEFAWGIVNSNQPFLWIIRPNLVMGEAAALPPELLEKIKGRGMIAKWCQQEQVLKHPSVGGFLTHCGWNSTLDSLCAEVPILCWPWLGDQCINRRYSCTHWGIGIEMNKDVKRDEVEKLVRNLMEGEQGKELILNFEVAPVLDLRVTPTDEDCTVEMLSCKFVGSEVLKRQNEHFSASMRNRITWDPNDTEPFLDVDVKLNLTLEIYTQPFTMLPISAVEGPGNLMMQTLLDRLVPLLVQQLLQDYSKWVQQQSRYLQ